MAGRPKPGDKMYAGKGSTAAKPPKKLKHNSMVEESLSNHFGPPLDDSSYFSRRVHGDAMARNGVDGGAENRVTFNLYFKSRREISDIKVRLQHELMLVRNLVMRIERFSGMKMPVDSGAPVRKLKRVHSEVGSVDGPESRPIELVSVNERKTRGTVAATPASVGRGASQKSSAVRLSEEKVPRPILTERSKAANGKRNRDEFVSMSGMQNSSTHVFKSCSAVLSNLMKSKGGWVFKKPVDVEGLGLHDYFNIIKCPMDLGTVKTRLATKWYRTPEEFAEDVRLTFYNAMAYNMEGHDVHTFAKQLLKMFEDNWVNIEKNYLRKSSTVAGSEGDLRTSVPISASMRSPVTAASLPPPVTAASLPPPVATASLPPPVTTTSFPPPMATASLSPPTDVAVKVDRLEVVTNAAGSEAKNRSAIASGKARLPKPKARDADKREMTLEEKQKLSAELQNLPSEKLEGVLRIIKKRNPSIYQNDDEIEVDIDTVDTETLWELDRYVIYYKKARSKMERRAELAQIEGVTEPKLLEMNQIDSGIEEANENEADENNNFSSSSNEGKKADRGNTSASNGSSSSSSDSGSSSDSDTNSSSS